MIGAVAFPMTAAAVCATPEPLRFRADGTFRILQITDTQDDHNIDFRTPALIREAILREDPDLVVCSGDCITGGAIASDQHVRDAIDAVFGPVEEAGVPFIVAFGNHDEDAYARGDAPNMGEAAQLEYYRNNFTCNINQPDDPDVTGDGDMVTFVYGSDKKGNGPRDAKLAIWAIDSGRYSPGEIGGQNIRYNDNGWDWIRQDQVDWYKRTSEEIERANKGKVPGIMFFHIPLFEFETMWSVDQGLFPSGDVPNPDPAADPGTVYLPKEEGRHRVEEERHECVCTGPLNSGLYAAAAERGDVMGMFVGHDHVNNYVGDYHGILLGYGASTGFGTYGLGGSQRHRLRGVRVHDFHEDDVTGYVTNLQTYFKRAGDDYGMCMATNEADCQGDPFFNWSPASVAEVETFAAPAGLAEASCPAPQPGIAYKSRAGERCPVATDEIAR